MTPVWHSHPNCSEFGGPSEDSQGLALAQKVYGRPMTCRQANTIPIYYFATCPDWVNDGKKLSNQHGQVFPNAYMPEELKDLPPGAELRFRYKGKEAVGIFLDVGPASWTKRYLDLGYPLARYLGFNGTGTVEWALAEGEPMASAAPACKAALAQATARWPKRDKSSDGIMGDAAHQSRVSDHNQGNAWDLTDDRAHGVDCSKIILEVIKDPRTRYAIHDRRIWERSTGKWRTYTGSNPHTGHMHVSIVVALRNNTAPWKGIALSPKPEDPPMPKQALIGVEIGVINEMPAMIASAKSRDNRFFAGAIPAGTEAAKDPHRLASILVAYCTDPKVKEAIDKLL